jgi:hypothetical protein
MPSITEELSAVLANFQKNAPDFAKVPINASRDDIIKTFDRSAVINEGQTLPEFELKDALGKPVSSKYLLSMGALLLVVSFIRYFIHICSIYSLPKKKKEKKKNNTSA